MSRLTKKFNDNSGYEVEEYGAKYNEVKLDAYLDAVNKLGELEDLEEQLGCPLEVIIRAVKYGIYIKNIDGDMVNFKCYLYYKNPELGWYFIIVNNGYVPLTDYKVKFWLKKDKSE